MVDRTAVDVAWAAGLFEGEGCMNVYARGRNGTPGMQMRLGMTDSDVVERFADIVGHGNVHGPRTRRDGEKPMWEWMLYEADLVRQTIELLLPYFGERRRARALEVLERGSVIGPHHGKKTHCPRGHELVGDNLVEEPIQRKSASGEVREYTARRCRQCRREQGRERMRKNHRVASGGHR